MVEFELISRQCRLRWLGDGTGRLNWRDLWVLLKQSDPDSPIGRQLSGRKGDWSIQEHLIAQVVDGLRAISWQIGGGTRPKPLQRPKLERQPAPPPQEESPSLPVGDPFKPDESGVFTGELTPLSELNEWLGWA